MSDSNSQLPPGSTEGSAVQHYKGGCHKDCGKIAFEFDHAPIESADTCNCSICSLRGMVMVYVPADRLKFTKGSVEDLTKYQFGKKIFKHEFCPSCGSPCLGEGFGNFAVNLKSVEGIDISKLKIKEHDGANRE